MKSNITDLPSDAESMRRLMPEMLERIRGRLEFLKQLDAPMTPQEDLPISEFVAWITLRTSAPQTLSNRAR